MAVIAETNQQDPEDAEFGRSDRIIDNEEAASLEEQVNLFEKLSKQRELIEQERKPLAEKRERERFLDIERTRRIEQNYVSGRYVYWIIIKQIHGRR